MREEIEQVFERWKATMGHSRARLDMKREKAIRAMLAIGYTVEDLNLAIFGCSVSPFHQGQNDRGTKFEDIALICRDAEHVDKFIALAEKIAARARPNREPLVEKTPMPENVRAMVRR